MSARHGDNIVEVNDDATVGTNDGTTSTKASLHPNGLLSALKGSRHNLSTQVKKINRVSFNIDGDIIYVHEADNASSDEDDSTPNIMDANQGEHPTLASEMGNAWYFQICSNFSVEDACRALNLKHKEMLHGGENSLFFFFFTFFAIIIFDLIMLRSNDCKEVFHRYVFQVIICLFRFSKCNIALVISIYFVSSFETF